MLNPKREDTRGTRSIVVTMSLAQPLLEVFGNEIVIREVRIALTDAIDLRGLPVAECFVGVKAPVAFKQSLTPQHLVNTRDAAGEIVGRVKQHGVGISDLNVPAQQLDWN